jgi:hypothetical protein
VKTPFSRTANAKRSGNQPNRKAGIEKNSYFFVTIEVLKPCRIQKVELVWGVDRLVQECSLAGEHKDGESILDSRSAGVSLALARWGCLSD